MVCDVFFEEGKFTGRGSKGGEGLYGSQNEVVGFYGKCIPMAVGRAFLEQFRSSLGEGPHPPPPPAFHLGEFLIGEWCARHAPGIFLAHNAPDQHHTKQPLWFLPALVAREGRGYVATMVPIQLADYKMAGGM